MSPCDTLIMTVKKPRTITLDSDVDRIVSEFAFAQGLSVSAFVNRALIMHLNILREIPKGKSK